MSPHAQEVSGYIDFNVSMATQNLWRLVSLTEPDRTRNTLLWVKEGEEPQDRAEHD